ncbi:ArsR/SmtB family transcription factor [Conexibacter arvalis]|nr:metalloregulator ArsR/SmtB family transcription factor [Conexibacter arvalis]
MAGGGRAASGPPFGAAAGGGAVPGGAAGGGAALPLDASAGAVFHALADPTRRAVVRELSRQETVTASALTAQLPMTRQAIAKHLATLADAGLVAAERAGRETRYRLTPDPLEEAMRWMAEVGGQWDRRLERLRRHVGGGS